MSSESKSVDAKGRQLSILSQASRGFNSELSATSVMRTLVRWALQLAGGDTGTYGILRAGSLEFTEYINANSGLWEDIDRKLAVCHCAPGQLTRASEPYFTGDAERDPRADHTWREYVGARSLIEIPILNSKGELLGALHLSSKEANRYSHEDLELMQGLAANAAIAFENAQLHARARSEMDGHDAALRASEERFYRAQEAAKIGAFDWNLTSDKLAWWAEVPALRGMVPEGLFESWCQFLHPDDLERVKSSIRRATQAGRDFDVDGRLIRPDGETVWFRSVGHLLQSGDSTPHYVGITIDISSRKMTEEALLNSEKLAAIGRMAATIAHEINNPLEAVLNLVYLARMSTPDQETKGFLNTAEQEIARISHITKQTLGFYHDTTAPSQLDLSALVEETVSLYQRKLAKKNIIVRTKLQRPTTLDGLGGELKQVVSNLLANAIDVSEEHSAIYLRTRECGAFAQLTVADRGSGIPPELLAQIFAPFFTTKKQVGTGLGLWVTRSIVEKHCGSIRLRSRVGAHSGTVFMVRLPKTRLKLALVS